MTLGGCPAPPTGGGLTSSQQTAVRDVVKLLDRAAAVAGTLGPLAEPQLNLDTIGTLGNFGTCPRVTFVASATSAAIQIDFGTAGCSSDATAGATVAGSVGIIVNRTTRAAAVTLSNLSIGGASVTGSAELTVTNREAGGVTLAGSFDFAIADVGTATGDVTIDVDSDGLMTINSDAVTLTMAGGAGYVVTLADIVSDPQGNASFIPESGAVTFLLPGDGTGAPTTIVVTFTAQSPTNGIVQVRVDNGVLISFAVPGLVG
jgi:hypothetical protein